MEIKHGLLESSQLGGLIYRNGWMASFQLKATNATAGPKLVYFFVATPVLYGISVSMNFSTYMYMQYVRANQQRSVAYSILERDYPLDNYFYYQYQYYHDRPLKSRSTPLV